MSFDCCAEWIERVYFVQVGLQRFSIRMRLELMNQLLDCFLAGVIMLLDGRVGESLDPTAGMVGGCSRVKACGHPGVHDASSA